MNCPIKSDPAPDEGHNQNPPEHANEITTNNTLNHRRNSTTSRNSRIHLDDGSHGSIGEEQPIEGADGALEKNRKGINVEVRRQKNETEPWSGNGGQPSKGDHSWFGGKTHKLKKVLIKYSKFIGPGFMVSVAYIDPGSYLSIAVLPASQMLIESF
jgi:metal iron transporter